MIDKPLVVIPSFMRDHNELMVTSKCLTSLSATAGDLCDVLVVDDCSPNKDALEALATLCGQLGFEIHPLENNNGFAQTVNVGLREALQRGSDAVLVNADIDFQFPNWLEPLRDSDAYVSGSLLLYPNFSIQHAGIYYSFFYRGFAHIYQYAPYNLPEAKNPRICPVTAALQYIKLECLQEIGVYDEGFIMGYEDVSYCLDVFKSGNSCRYVPDSKAVHHESMFRGISSDKEESELFSNRHNESIKYLMEKHQGLCIADYVPTMLTENGMLVDA